MDFIQYNELTKVHRQKKRSNLSRHSYSWISWIRFFIFFSNLCIYGNFLSMFACFTIKLSSSLVFSNRKHIFRLVTFLLTMSFPKIIYQEHLYVYISSAFVRKLATFRNYSILTLALLLVILHWLPILNPQ